MARDWYLCVLLMKFSAKFLFEHFAHKGGYASDIPFDLKPLLIGIDGTVQFSISVGYKHFARPVFCEFVYRNCNILGRNALIFTLGAAQKHRVMIR